MAAEEGDDDGTSDGDGAPPRRHRRRASSDSIPLPASSGRITTELVGPPLRLPDESHPGMTLPDPDESTDEDLRLEPAPSASAPPPRDVASIPPPPRSGALGLVERSRRSSSGLDLMAEMRERFELDDFTGALRAAELVLGRHPEHEEAESIADASRRKLERIYLSRLGALQARARVKVERAEIRWLGLDHRAGFLLSRVDGSHSIEELLEVSGMPRLETLKTLVELLQVEAIAIDEPGT